MSQSQPLYSEYSWVYKVGQMRKSCDENDTVWYVKLEHSEREKETKRKKERPKT